MGRVLSPARAIDSPELLKGRDEQLQEIRRARYQGGRQIFIYGYRGVGQTSLAQTAAHQHQSAADPVHHNGRFWNGCFWTPAAIELGSPDRLRQRSASSLLS